MHLRQLEIFVEVVNHKSFSKAAEAVYISQPSVSVCINALEQELNAQLLYRTTKCLQTTEAGKILYSQAKNILGTWDKTKKSIYKLSNPENSSEVTGSVEILASSAPSQYLLPGILAEFHKEYPNIKFQVSQNDSAGVLKGISEQRCELGIIGMYNDNPKFEFKKIYCDSLILISSKKQNECVELLSFLMKNDFIGREIGSGTRLAYEKLMNETGIKPLALNTCAIFSNTQSIIQAVMSGMGVSITSKLAARQYIEQGLVFEVETDVQFPKRDFYLVKKADFMLNHISEIFVDHVIKRSAVLF